MMWNIDVVSHNGSKTVQVKKTRDGGAIADSQKQGAERVANKPQATDRFAQRRRNQE